MKVVIGGLGAALGAALALATVAMAQTPSADAGAPAAAVPGSRCPSFPPEPTLPDGATARNAAAMQAGDAAYQEWGRTVQSILECRRVEATELQAQAQAVTAQAQTRVTEYNEAVQRLTAVGQAWQAEAAEYNARGGRSGTRTR